MPGADQIIFRAGGRTFSCADAIRAADARSALGPVRQHVRLGLASQRYAGDEGFELGPSTLESAADSYRLEHDLTTADDTEAWLDQHGLAVDDLWSWLERGLWRERFLHDASIIIRDYAPEAAEIEMLVWPEVVFGDHLAGFERDLAARVAARLAQGGDSLPPGWADDLAGMERDFLSACSGAGSSHRIEREVEAQGPSLVRLDVQLASFPTEGSAREAWACATEDGESLDEVSRRAGGEIVRRRLFLDELPEALQPTAIAARQGEVLAPAEVGGRIVLCRVVAKDLPTEGEAEVRRRVESLLVARTTEDLIDRHIEWV